MKKLFLFFSFLLCSCMVSYGQEDDVVLLIDYLTEEEKTITEKDMDDAFIAPSSKFVGKKWYVAEDCYFLFNANGTGKMVTNFIDTDYGDLGLHGRYIVPLKWKLVKQYLYVTFLFKQQIWTIDESDLKKLSLRKQNEIRRYYANYQKRSRIEDDNEEGEGDINKITNDYFFWRNTYLVSPKKRDEIKKREAEKAAKKREAEGAAKGNQTGGKIYNMVEQMPSLEGNQTGGKIYDLVEQMPSFKGNISQWLSSNLTYPEAAAANGIQGRVIVQFVVEKDGSIGNVQVVSSVSPALDHEAVDVVKRMPLWNPGMQDGSPVRVKFTLPITFKL